MLSTELMRRIGEVVPVLPVPMVSYLLLQRGAMSEAALLQALRDTVARMPLASIHLPEHAHDAAIQSAILQMRRRKLIRTSGGVVTPDRSQIDMLRYYANSIAHLVPAALEPPSEEEVISATAKENSASAGS